MNGRLARALAGGALALAASAVVVAVGAGPASAHDYVVSTTPPAGSTVTAAVPQVALTFDDVVLDPQHDGSTTVLRVTDAAGGYVETGCATVLGRTISVPVSLGAPGRYTVTWRIVSADGHPVSGTYAFTYAPSSGATGPAGSTTPACGTAGSHADAGTSGPGSSGSSAVNLGAILGVGGGVVVVAAVVVVVLVTRRARRDAAPDDAEPSA